MLPETKCDLVNYAKSLEIKLLLRKDGDLAYRDGDGWRYMIPQIYLFAGEPFESILSYERFCHDYPDDISDPAMQLAVCLAFLREKHTTAAKEMLYKLIFSNIYFIPYLIHATAERKDLWHGSNVADIGYINDVDPRVFSLWKKKEIEWVSRIFYSGEYQMILESFIDTRTQLNNEKEISKRRVIIEKENTLKSLYAAIFSK